MTAVISRLSFVVFFTIDHSSQSSPNGCIVRMVPFPQRRSSAAQLRRIASRCAPGGPGDARSSSSRRHGSAPGHFLTDVPKVIAGQDVGRGREQILVFDGNVGFVQRVELLDRFAK